MKTYQKGEIIGNFTLIEPAEAMVGVGGGKYRKTAGYRILCRSGRESVLKRFDLDRQEFCSRDCKLLSALKSENFRTMPRKKGVRHPKQERNSAPPLALVPPVAISPPEVSIHKVTLESKSGLKVEMALTLAEVKDILEGK